MKFADVFSRMQLPLFLLPGLGFAYIDQLQKSNQRIRDLLEQNSRLKGQQLQTQVAMHRLLQKIVECRGNSLCIQSVAQQVLNPTKKKP